VFRSAGEPATKVKLTTGVFTRDQEQAHAEKLRHARCSGLLRFATVESVPFIRRQREQRDNVISPCRERNQDKLANFVISPGLDHDFVQNNEHLRGSSHQFNTGSHVASEPLTRPAISIGRLRNGFESLRETLNDGSYHRPPGIPRIRR